MPARHAVRRDARPGDGLVRLGAVVFGVGVVAVVLAVVPFLLDRSEDAGPLSVVAGSLLPIGFAISLVGLLRGARTNRRAARRSSTRS